MPLKVDLLYPNSSQYGVLHHFTEKLFEACRRVGLQARLLKKEEYERLIFSDPPDFTMGFNGAPKTEEGDFLCDQALVPHVSCLVDPPYRFLDLQTSPYILIGCDDAFCAEMFCSPRHPHYFFFPHGVEPELAPDDSIKRIYNVVFLGSFIDGEKRRRRWGEHFPAQVCRAMEDAVDVCLKDENIHFMQAFLEAVNRGIGAEGMDSFNLPRVFEELELYIKARDRIALISALKHCKIDIFGSSIDEEGWSSHFKGAPNIAVHPPVGFEEALRIMQQSKVVLNSGLKSQYGAHERVFSGLAAGAAVVTSSNPFTLSQFTDRESILFYRYHDLDQLDEKVLHYLHNESERAALANQGRALVMQNHTWDARMKAILPMITPVIKAFR